MKTYKTIIRNETEGRLSLCTDFFGDRKANLAPGQEGYTIGVWFMNFARYSKVVYQERGEVSLTKRLNFKTNFKKEQLVLRLENKHDLIENYKFGSLYFGSYTAPFGVPIFVPVHPLDPLASWSSITAHPDFIGHKRIIQGFSPVPYLAGKIDHGERWLIRSPNLTHKKRSKSELKKLEELQKKMIAEDPDYYKHYSSKVIWSKNAWTVSDEDLYEPGDAEKIKEGLAMELEEQQRKHQMSYKGEG